jgi:hypothetical protein
VRLDPRSDELDVFPLPGKNAMVRGLTVDAWSMACATPRSNGLVSSTSSASACSSRAAIRFRNVSPRSGVADKD